MTEEIKLVLLRQSVDEVTKLYLEKSEKQNRMLAEMREQLVGVCLKLGITEIEGRPLLTEEKLSHCGESSFNSNEILSSEYYQPIGNSNNKVPDSCEFDPVSEDKNVQISEILMEYEEQKVFDKVSERSTSENKGGKTSEHVTECHGQTQFYFDGRHKRNEMRNSGVYQVTTRCSSMEFPRFNGIDLRGWVYRCEQFFDVNCTPSDTKVELAAVHLEGKALQWHQVYLKSRLTRDIPRWEEYVRALNNRFGTVLYEEPMGELMNLKQTGSVKDYLNRFDDLMNCLNLNDLSAVKYFLAGLKSEIAVSVQQFKPKLLQDAVNLAKLQEQVLSLSKGRLPSPSHKPFQTSPRCHSEFSLKSNQNFDDKCDILSTESLGENVAIDELKGLDVNVNLELSQIVTKTLEVKEFDELPKNSIDVNAILQLSDDARENCGMQVFDQLSNKSELNDIDQTIGISLPDKDVRENGDENISSKHLCCKENLQVIANCGGDDDGKIKKYSDSICEENPQITEVGIVDEEEGMNYLQVIFIEKLNFKLEGLRSLGGDSCFPLTWPQILHRLRSQQGGFNVVVELSEIAKYNEWQCYAIAPLFHELQMVDEVPYMNLHNEEMKWCLMEEWREIIEGIGFETGMEQWGKGNCSNKIIFDLIREQEFIIGGTLLLLKCPKLKKPLEKICQDEVYRVGMISCLLVIEQPQLPLPPPEPPPQQILALSNPWSLRTRTV